MEELLVRLIKHARPDTTYRAALLSDDGTHVVVQAPWSGPGTRDMGFVRFEAGSVIRLDEDEFAAAALDALTAESAMRALDELEAFCRTRVIGYGMWDEL